MYKLLPSNILPRLVIGLFLGLFLSLGFTNSAVAQTSKSDAAIVARAQTGGKVLQVKQNKNGHFRVKVLMPNGQMRHIIVSKTNPSSKK